LALVGAVAVVFAQAPSPHYDIIIRNGRVVDGTGDPSHMGDVAIKDGKLALVGSVPPDATATRTIDATGLVVSPGFIDLHSHSDVSVLEDGNAQSKIRDGVTLDIIGEDSSVAPRDGMPPQGVADWTNFTQYFAKLMESGTSINIASYVSAEQVRRVVMGYSAAAPTAAQLEEMRELVARSMEEGAVGLVTLFESGLPAYPDEIIEMAKVAAKYGGTYGSHIGSEGFQQTEELNFFFQVAEQAQIPSEIFHFKIRARENWGTMQKYVDMVNAARARGLKITANVYPYTAMSHPWRLFFPTWVNSGSPQQFAQKLNDPEVQAKLKQDPEFIRRSKEHGGWDGIVMANAYKPEDKKYEGMSIAAIAEMRGDADPADTCIKLMANEDGRINGVYHTLSEPDVRTVMKQPWVGFGSDGSAISVDAPGVPHPRNFSTHATVLGYYVREQHVLTLEDAVRKSSGLPAQILGFTDRGLLQPGMVADVTIFDPNTVGATDSYEKPKSYSKGIPYVLVNGTIVIDKGEHTGARPGRPVYGKGYRPGGSAIEVHISADKSE
jgi:N-acyl-D-amino-acid deacylase